MSLVAISEEKINKWFKFAFTAVGFAIAHYLYISIYNLLSFFAYKNNELESLVYFFLAALFFWLLKKAKEEKKVSTMMTMLMIYFGERVCSLVTLANEGDSSAALMQFLICAPIIFFLIRGLRAAIDFKAVRYAKQALEEAPWGQGI